MLVKQRIAALMKQYPAIVKPAIFDLRVMNETVHV
jgi:hypothetical protein